MKQKRARWIHVRLTEKEYQRVSKAAKKEKTTISEYVRRKVGV